MPVTIGGSGPITGVTSINTSVSDTELGYLDGVTSAIQSQINTAGGLVKVTDQSFSAASAVNVNNCFTTTYDNYRVIFSWNSASSSQDILRLRASGTDATTNYYASGIASLVTSNAVEYFPRSNNATSVTVSLGTTSQKFISLDLYNPAKSENTLFAGTHVYATGAVGYVIGGAHLTASAYDGFSLIAGTGNMTGTVRVYGYRN